MRGQGHTQQCREAWMECREQMSVFLDTKKKKSDMQMRCKMMQITDIQFQSKATLGNKSAAGLAMEERAQQQGLALPAPQPLAPPWRQLFKSGHRHQNGQCKREQWQPCPGRGDGVSGQGGVFRLLRGQA